MTLDEAIKHAQWVADTNCDQCAEDHRQLAEWLKELKELRKLGWHPASELPPVNKDTGYSDVVCFYANARDGRKLFLFEGRYCKAYIGEKKAHNPFINDGWCYVDGGKINEVLNVKWWCYPPKKE